MNVLMKHSVTQARKAGFTIVELVVVVVVIAILASIVVVGYSGAREQAMQSNLKTDLRGASAQVKVEKSNKGTYPATQAEVDGGKGLKKSEGTVYQYVAGSAGYCISASSDRTSKVFRITSSQGNVEDGTCTGVNVGPVVAPALEPLVLDSPYNDGVLTFISWTWPAGVSSTTPYTVVVKCPESAAVTFLSTSDTDTFSQNSMFTWSNTNYSTLTCTVSKATTTIFYNLSGKKSPDMVVRPADFGE